MLSAGGSWHSQRQVGQGKSQQRPSALCWPPFDFQQWQLWGDAQLIWAFGSLLLISQSENYLLGLAWHLLKPHRHHLLKAASFWCCFFLVKIRSLTKIYLRAQDPTTKKNTEAIHDLEAAMMTRPPSRTSVLCWPVSPLLMESARVVASWEMVQF